MIFPKSCENHKVLFVLLVDVADRVLGCGGIAVLFLRPTEIKRESQCCIIATCFHYFITPYLPKIGYSQADCINCITLTHHVM